MVTGPASSAENGDPAARPPARLPLNSSPTASHRRTGRCLICPSPSLPSAGRARAGGSTRWTLPSIGGIGRRRRSRGSVISWRRSGPPSRLKTRRRAHGQISPSCWPQSAVHGCAARQHGRSALSELRVQGMPSPRSSSPCWCGHPPLQRPARLLRATQSMHPLGLREEPSPLACRRV